MINKTAGRTYDHKALPSYIPALQTLNDKFAESKTTKKFNKYFMSKNNYYHSALFLLISKLWAFGLIDIANSISLKISAFD